MYVYQVTVSMNKRLKYDKYVGNFFLNSML
jgi:hypothetical protein